jgi:hypothetical protein
MDETQLNAVLSRIEELSKEREDFWRDHYSERVTGRINKALEAAGVNQDYAKTARDFARGVVGYDDLIEKSMNGEEITDREITQKVEDVKQSSPVWFEEASVRSRHSLGVSGASPASPEGSLPKQMTHEEREQKMDVSHYP